MEANFKNVSKFPAIPFFQELPSDNEDSGPPSMAPPPLPADYTGGGMGGLGGGATTNNGVSSTAAAANNMGWNVAPPAQPQTSALINTLDVVTRSFFYKGWTIRDDF